MFVKLKSLNYLYEINENGVLRNVKTKRIVKGYTENNGYQRVRIENKGIGGIVRTSIHQLVAEAFIPNPDNKPFINHIDCNKQNNCVDNLEWVTHSENMRHAYMNGLGTRGLIEHRENTKKRITNGERIFPSISDASAWLVSQSKCSNISSGIAGISAVINGRRKTLGGYNWKTI